MQATTAVMRPSEAVRPVNLRRQLAEAAGQSAEQQRLLQTYLQSAVARVLGLRNPEQIDPREGLLDMGLDSLMAVELRNQIGRMLETRLPSTLIFDYPTIDALRSYLLAELFGDQAVAPPATVAPPAPELQAEQLPTAKEAESDDEIAKLLAQLVYSSN